MESGIHPSLHCHYQVTHAKFNLKTHYPPPYEREIWHFQKANTDQIREAIEQFSWDRSFKNLDFNKMVFLLNKTIKNILSNYIRHEIIICDDRDPPWINNRVKELINEKSDTFQYYLHSNKDPKSFSKVEYLQNKLKELPSLLFKRTENVISSIDFGSDGIAKIIHNLDSEFRIHNVIPVHKKGNKQTLENYHPVSLLPICG